MADLRLPLTDKNIAALPLAATAQYLARDTDLAGFFLLVGIRIKSFMIQGDLRVRGQRQSIRLKVAEVGELSARDAKAKAKAMLGAIATGTDPREKKRKPDLPKTGAIPTLRHAWERYRLSHLEKTIAGYKDHVHRLFVDWLDTPLSELGDNPGLVADRHDTITRDNGPTMANGAMRSLRAIYNHARKTCRQLPAENPTFAVDWNPEQRRDTAMGVKDLPGWFEQLAGIQNPIRREFQLLTLLSGSRPEALKSVSLTDVDLAGRRIRIRKPKGGEDKAFDIPLSRAMLESILRLRRLGPAIYPDTANIWLFPSDAPSGHLEEHKEDRAKVLSHWGNDLRQSFRTFGQIAGVSELDCQLLMNHSIQGVNPGYITRSKLIGDHLREQQEKISRLITGSVVGCGRRPSVLLSRWLNSTSRVLLKDLLDADPDAVRSRVGARSALRKLEIQSARCDAQQLDPGMLDAPSRRLKQRHAA
jgi:hypothetical protein